MLYDSAEKKNDDPNALLRHTVLIPDSSRTSHYLEDTSPPHFSNLLSITIINRASSPAKEIRARTWFRLEFDMDDDFRDNEVRWIISP